MQFRPRFSLRSLLMMPLYFAARIWICFLCLLFAAVNVRAGDSANLLLHQEGTQIVDSNGRAVKLRGFNLGGWLSWEGWIFGHGILTSETDILKRLTTLVGAEKTQAFQNNLYRQFIAEDDIRQIAEVGFNSVRLPLNYRLFDSGVARAEYQEQGWARVDQLLDWCDKYHVYVVLDLHAAPGGQSGLGMADPGDAPQRLWRSEECQDKTVALWRALAARYKDRTIVAGYDLLNEPTPNSGKELADLYDRIVASIREVDPQHMIFLEGDKFASDFCMFAQPPCKNMVYSFHIYTWFGDNRAKQLAAYRALAKKQNVPLWVGEFGENNYEMIDSTVKMFAEIDEIAGWSFWTWKKAPSGSPGAAVVKLPADWDATMKWVGNPLLNSKPTADIAERGTQEFLGALAVPKVQIDSRMLKILKPNDK